MLLCERRDQTVDLANSGLPDECGGRARGKVASIEDSGGEAKGTAGMAALRMGMGFWAGVLVGERGEGESLC
jgi:hypothetical protein